MRFAYGGRAGVHTGAPFKPKFACRFGNWAGLDSNQRTALAEQIYSLSPLTTRPPTHTRARPKARLGTAHEGTTPPRLSPLAVSAASNLFYRRF